jgi:hypothetical protein
VGLHVQAFVPLQQPPAMASCSGVLVTAKRTVTAKALRPWPCQRAICASQSRRAPSTSSRRPSGAWRSISTLPVMMRMPRTEAASNSASADTACTVGNTTAAVVPWASSASRNSSAPARATAGSAKRCSAGKV